MEEVTPSPPLTTPPDTVGEEAEDIDPVIDIIEEEEDPVIMAPLAPEEEETDVRPEVAMTSNVFEDDVADPLLDDEEVADIADAEGVESDVRPDVAITSNVLDEDEDPADPVMLVVMAAASLPIIEDMDEVEGRRFAVGEAFPLCHL